MAKATVLSSGEFMGRIGVYHYPDITLEEARLILQANIEHHGKFINAASLARLLGHVNERSGAFKRKLQSLRRWGLINSENQLTNLGISLISAENNEDWNKISLIALNNVLLFKHLLKQLDKDKKDVSMENFKKALIKVTRADEKELERKWKHIWKIFSRTVRNIKGVIKGVIVS